MDAPFFVVGCGRSGSTMLRLMLDAHPDLAVPGESHFIPPLWRRRREYERDGRLDADALAADIAGTPHFGHWKIPPEPYLEAIRALDRPSFAEVVERAFLANAENHGKRRWADKTPIHVRHIELLSRLWPSARFVHLIRDGRDVALSYLTVPWGPRTVLEAAWKWRRDVSAGRAASGALGPERYVELRYERLVEDPRGALEELCAFVDLPFDARMLDHAREVDRERLAPASGLPYHARAATPPAAGARDWRTEMSEGDAADFEALAGRLLADLGYPPGPRRPGLESRARASLAAAVLAARERAGEARKALRRGRAGGAGPPRDD